MSRWKWFSITLCTTIATGILFWGTAEPIFHLHASPTGSENPATFAMSTMFMHWTITPYSIYTLTGLLFALCYYNYGQSFSLGALIYPLSKNRKIKGLGSTIDMICLYALVTGMAASLGAGILSISGGLRLFLDFEPSVLIYGLIAGVIVLCFIISAGSGLLKGIKLLSDWNIRAFFLLALIVLVFGPTRELFILGGKGLIDYLIHFPQRSVGLDPDLSKAWTDSWTVFYWANWMAWAPVTALFLGRLALGYTVRDFIHFNLLLPSLFGGLWMIIFSGASIYYDQQSGGAFNTVLTNQGPEQIIYTLFERLPYSNLLSLIFILIAFLSYVTAADSNISAMSGMSVDGISPERPEAPLWIKITWGIVVGAVAWVMISYAGIDGIKLISTLGGFPALLLIIFVGIGMVRLVVDESKGG